MSKGVSGRFVAGFREFAAEIVGQFVLYATLLGALAAWLYFGTVYAPLLVGGVGLILFWLVYGVVLGKKDKKDKKGPGASS